MTSVSSCHRYVLVMVVIVLINKLTLLARSVIYTSLLAWCSLSFSARILCCSALSDLHFFFSKTENTFHSRLLILRKIRLTFYISVDVHSQFSPWGRSAPLLLSSYARNEHRWGTAAQECPCSDVSSECPAFRHTRNNLTDKIHGYVCFKGSQRYINFYVKVHFFTIWDLGCWWPVVKENTNKHTIS